MFGSSGVTPWSTPTSTSESDTELQADLRQVLAKVIRHRWLAQVCVNPTTVLPVLELDSFYEILIGLSTGVSPVRCGVRWVLRAPVKQVGAHRTSPVVRLRTVPMIPGRVRLAPAESVSVKRLTQLPLLVLATIVFPLRLTMTLQQPTWLEEVNVPVLLLNRRLPPSLATPIVVFPQSP